MATDSDDGFHVTQEAVNIFQEVNSALAMAPSGTNIPRELINDFFLLGSYTDNLHRGQPELVTEAQSKAFDHRAATIRQVSAILRAIGQENLADDLRNAFPPNRQAESGPTGNDIVQQHLRAQAEQETAMLPEKLIRQAALTMELKIRDASRQADDTYVADAGLDTVRIDIMPDDIAMKGKSLADILPPDEAGRDDLAERLKNALEPELRRRYPKLSSDTGLDMDRVQVSFARETLMFRDDDMEHAPENQHMVLNVSIPRRMAQRILEVPRLNDAEMEAVNAAISTTAARAVRRFEANAASAPEGSDVKAAVKWQSVARSAQAVGGVQLLSEMIERASHEGRPNFLSMIQGEIHREVSNAIGVESSRMQPSQTTDDGFVLSAPSQAVQAKAAGNKHQLNG